jgi:hypothetical protein
MKLYLQQHAEEASNDRQTNGTLAHAVDTGGILALGWAWGAAGIGGGAVASLGISRGLAGEGTLDDIVGTELLVCRAVNLGSGLHVEATLDILELGKFGTGKLLVSIDRAERQMATYVEKFPEKSTAPLTC